MAEQKTKEYTPRLKALYKAVVAQEVMKKFDLKNVWEVPRLKKVVVNMGVSLGKDDIKFFDQMKDDLSLITGQAPSVRRAKKSIAGFKIRQGQPLGVMVTLRHDRMWEFLDRLLSISLARIRDFRGLEPRGFDEGGNYNLGLREHHIFPEVSLERSPKAHGLNITVATTSPNPDQVKTVLELLGFPFRKPSKSS